ncbi:3-deoxy-manno-octulosonate cytidylyltransferase [Cytophaga aurantiaca]|uniref:3-deoxy-manno-octulosonate cytidylyltransferase n=1 Tax=Cytophaga aurantiaca TaxID=29530 RepID=UPI0003686540|nr:3-deoxy-manno-octulosonate cytidylyltransferase [Cytophaga aurantiaca]
MANKISIAAIIPARYASTRFPGKPLVQINGKTMIQCVYDQVKSTPEIDEVIVATDDDRIETEVIRFGGKVVRTKPEHPSGTDRCYEAYQKLNKKFDFVINVQGDEPFIQPEQIRTLAAILTPDVELATLIKKIEDEETLFNPNTPKVLVNAAGEAIYFSRQTIPYLRQYPDKKDWLVNHTFFKHIGMYAYRPDILAQITQLKPSALELAESLEQLRWLESGYKIKTAVTTIETVGIDTPEDLERVTSR